MKKKEIEYSLKKVAGSFTPDVFNNIMDRIDEPINEGYPFPIKNSNNKSRFNKKLVLAFSILLIAIIGASIFTGIMMQDYEVVYLEINPSVEIITNRLNRVKEIKYLNEDAQALLIDYDAKGKELDSVVEIFIDLSYQKGYIKEGMENNIYIYVNSKKEEKAQETADRLKEKVASKTARNNYSAVIQSQKITREQSKEAEEKNISVAKMQLINQIILKDDSYTLEELKTTSMKDLRDLLKQLKENENDSHIEYNNNGNGNGNGNANANGNANGK